MASSDSQQFTVIWFLKLLAIAWFLMFLLILLLMVIESDGVLRDFAICCFGFIGYSLIIYFGNFATK